MATFNGILLVDKPLEWTSFDVVAKTRSVLRKLDTAKTKVGHSGTLDPLASGLLIVLVGSYTKRANEYLGLDKVYEVEIVLGQNSSTGDGEGDKTSVSDYKPSQEEVEECLKSFVGQSEQLPPMYSAIKINGQPAYKLARQGKTAELKPRTVTIYSLEITGYSYPKISFSCRVSSGTYIRSLAEDIGSKLNTGAYVSQLRRTSVGQFKVEQAVQINELNESGITQHLIQE